MSYILEALKKAESERKLGSVPNMHAQPLATASDAGSPLWRSPLAWGVLIAALLSAAVITWLAPWQADQRSTTAVAPQSPQASSGNVSANTRPEVAPTPPVAAPDIAPPPIAQAPVDTQAPARQEDVVPEEPAKPKAVPKPVIKKKSEPAKAAETEQPVERKKEVAAAPAAPAVPAAPPEPRPPALRELPDNIQREIPPLVVGGYIYSSVPAERSVLINNRLLREGSEIAPGLTLEKMLPKEAVLNYRGTRYRISY